MWPAVLVLGVALVLRFHAIGRHDLWLDEAFSGMLTLIDRAEWWRIVGTEPTHPLFAILHRVWSAIFGHGVAAIRSFSAVAGSLAALLAYAIARRASRAAGLAAGLAVAISPLHVHYSQDARMYGLLHLLLLGAIACLLRALEAEGRGRTRWLAAYALCGAGALLSHTFSAFALAAAPLVALARGRRAAIEVTAATAAAAVPLLPFLPTLLDKSRSAATDWMGDAFRAIPPALAIPRTLEVFTPGALYPPYTQFRLGAPLFRPAAFVLCAAALLPGLRAAARAWPGRGAEKPRMDPIALLALTGAAFLFVPLLLLWGVSFLKPIYLVARYDLIAFPGFALLAGAGIASLPRPARALVAIAAVVLAAASLAPHYASKPGEVLLAEAVREKLVPALGAGDALIFTGFSESEVRYGLLRAARDPAFHTVPASTKEHPGWIDTRLLTSRAAVDAEATRVAAEAAAEARARAGRVWVVVDPRAPGPQQVVDALQALGWRAQAIVELLPATPPRWGAPLQAIAFGSLNRVGP